MSRKKVTVAALVGFLALGTGVSLAANPGAFKKLSGVYVGLEGGLSNNSMYNFIPEGVGGTNLQRLGETTLSSVTGATTKNTPWGITASGYVGYQFSGSSALQLGVNWSQAQQLNATVTGTVNGTSVASTPAVFKLNAYSIYFALRGNMYITSHFSTYFLAGPSWTYLSQNASVPSVTLSSNKDTDSFIGVVGAMGFMYRIDQRFALKLQYMYLIGDQINRSLSKLRTDYEGTQRWTMGVEYLFVA